MMNQEKGLTSSSFTFEEITTETLDRGYFILPPKTDFDLILQLPSVKDIPLEEFLKDEEAGHENLGTFAVEREIMLGGIVSIHDSKKEKSVGLKLINPYILQAWEEVKKWKNSLEIPTNYLEKNPNSQLGFSTNYDRFFKDYPELSKIDKWMFKKISVPQKRLEREFFAELGLNIAQEYSMLYLNLPLVKDR